MSASIKRWRDEALALYKPPLRRKSTYLKVRKVLDEVVELGLRRVTELTPMAIVRWLEAHADRAPMTNKSYLAALRPCVNYAKQMGYIRVTPWEIRKDWIAFDFDEEDDPTARHLSLNEIESYLAQLDADAVQGTWRDLRRQALGYTYAYTGMRKMEVLGLKVTDLRLDERLIVLRSRRRRRLKTRTSTRLVGIAPDLVAIYERWLPLTKSEWLFPGARRLGPWTGGPQGYKPLDEIKSVGERAGIRGVTIHSFRRSLATHARRFGISREEVRDWMGHGSVQIQEEWYLEQDADNRRAMADRLNLRPRLLPLRPPTSPVDPPSRRANAI